MLDKRSIAYNMPDVLELLVMKGKVLGVDVYRGYARCATWPIYQKQTYLIKRPTLLELSAT